MAVIATSWVVQVGQVRNEVPDKERHLGPPGWGLGTGLTSESRSKERLVEKTVQSNSQPTQIYKPLKRLTMTKKRRDAVKLIKCQNLI